MVQKNKIHIFGDSFSFGHNGDVFFPSYNKWRELKGSQILPPEWFIILSQKLDFDYRNHARMGASNDATFHKFVSQIDEINENDIVIINWTYIHRFRWGTKSNEHFYGYYDVSSAYDEPDDVRLKFSRNTKNEILYNRTTFDIWKEDIYNYQKVIFNISKFKKFKLFFWDTDGHILNKLPDYYENPIYLCSELILENIVRPNFMKDDEYHCDLFKLIRFYGGGTVFYETNGIVPDDTHLGERGHQIQGELFYNHIKKYI